VKPQTRGDHWPAQQEEVPIKAVDQASMLSISQWRRLARVLPWLLLAVGLSATWLVAGIALRAAQEAQEESFAYQTREILLRIEQRLAAYRQVLYGARGLFAASVDVNRDEFHAYVASLRLEKDYPGIQGVGFALLVPASGKAAHIEGIRKTGYPDYTLRPEGEREIYSSIIFLEPFADRNLRAFGYDMYSEAVRRKAMQRSRDLNEAAMSGKVRLVQEDGERVQAGFLMYVPVYRNGHPHATQPERRANLLGWAYSPFRMDDLMFGILGERRRDLELEIFDGEDLSPETLMHDSGDNLGTAQGVGGLYHSSQKLDIFGHRWTVVLRSLPPFEASLDTRLARSIQAAGVLTSVLLALLVWQLANSRVQFALALEMARELRISEERWKFALQGAGEGVWDWNIQTGEAMYSRRWKEMWGYAEHEIGNNSEEWARRVHPEDMPRVMAELQTHLDGQKVSAAVEFRMLCKDGSWRWTLGRGMVVRRDAAGQPLRLVGTNSDISERKAHDEALKRSNAELEQFNYAIAHDMRQPLRMISSYLQLLEMSLADSLDAEQSECLNFAIDGAKRLDQMLVGLLAFARVGRNGEVAPSSSRAALEEALHFVQSAVAEAHASISVEGDWPRIAVQHDETLRLLQNLISNAVKFRIPERTPEVRITGTTIDTEWRLVVADNGVGILPEQLGRLFQVFQRLQSRAHYEGTGIGLALCRKIAESHGGRIWAESAGEGLGSCFYVILPLAVDAAPAGGDIVDGSGYAHFRLESSR
jgi:PAS domain S-box-containing protein